MSSQTTHSSLPLVGGAVVGVVLVLAVGAAVVGIIVWLCVWPMKKITGK